MRDLIKPAFVLFAVSIIVVVLLAFTNELTAPVIAARTAADLAQAKMSVLPGATQFEDLTLPADLKSQSEGLGTVQEAWIAKDQAGTIVGTVVSLASKGYGGPVAYTVGIGPDGAVKGVRVGAHKETPGLGDKVVAPTSKVMIQLNKIVPTAPLRTMKGTPGANEVDAISGSTITSRSAVRAVSGAWELSQKLTPEGAWK